jgi:uncharacterized protein (TIGR02996 family)
VARKRLTIQDALLEVVCESPEDDAPRLVDADWLMEHGDAAGRARGEFGDAKVVRLAGCSHLANLTRLDFYGVSSLGDAGAVPWSNRPSWRGAKGLPSTRGNR